MDELLDEKINFSEKRFFTKRTVSVATFLGGPLIGGYMLAENFKVLNQPQFVKKTWLFTILITALILFIAFQLPENSKFPSAIFTITYVLIGVGAYSKLQDSSIVEQINKGASEHSFGRSALVTIVGLIITGSVFFGSIYLTESNQFNGIESKTYGTQAKHTIEYKKESIEEEDVDKIAETLTIYEFFDLEYPKYLYIERTKDKTHVFISVVEGLEKDQEGIDYFTDLHKKVIMRVPGLNIVFDLCVNDINNVVFSIE